MRRSGYFGLPIIRPGGSPPDRLRVNLAASNQTLMVSDIARPQGLAAHVANVKRQNTTLDAAVIVGRMRGFLTPATRIEPGGARDQNFGATGGQHAAHAVKRYTFDGRSIVAVFDRAGVDPLLPMGLQTMLGLVTDVDRRANLSIDKRLEGNPHRLGQLQIATRHSIPTLAAAIALAREMEMNRRMFEAALLTAMRGGFGGDAGYAAMLDDYLAGLSAPPAADETPDHMVRMITSLLD